MFTFDQEDSDALLWLLDILLSDGSVMALNLEAYFDESGTHAGALISCVAGYLFRREKAKAFSESWRSTLKVHGLPYFRMSECAHGNGHFSAFDVDRRIAIEKRMIELIKRHAEFGLAFTVNQDEFNEVIPSHPYISDAYSFCISGIMAGFRKLIQQQPKITAVAYIFEAGHEKQNAANKSINDLFATQIMKDAHRYKGHAFTQKADASALQAADLLAWQVCKDRERSQGGKPRRKDFQSLLELEHHVTHADIQLLRSLAEEFTASANGKVD